MNENVYLTQLTRQARGVQRWEAIPDFLKARDVQLLQV